MKDLFVASYVLGIQIYKDCSKNILGFSQMSYIEKHIQRYGIQDCKPLDTPISKGYKLSLNQFPTNALEIEEIQQFPYAQVFRSLMYAQVCSRSNIAYIVGGFGSIYE